MRRAIFHFLVVGTLTSLSLAQSADQDVNATSQDQPAHTMPSMPGMNMGEVALSSVPSFHASSGTAWQPASVPETMWMISPDGWQLMFHGVIFITYNHQGGPRG